MADQGTRTEAGLVAELNDLLQLDHDAVAAYTVAIDHLENPSYRETVIGFRGDHERHIEDLSSLIRQHDGIPISMSHVPTGLFKLALQKVAAMRSDREILLAFRANERQVRDKYHRIARRSGHPEAVRSVLVRNAADEDRHYEWAARTLLELGVAEDEGIGRAEAVFEKVHSRTADAVEGAERKLMEGTERARRAAQDSGPRAREAASSGLYSAANMVDRAGSWAEQKGGSGQRAGSAAHRMADSLEGAAAYLRRHDTSEMREDLERRIDRSPVRSVVLAAGLGYVVGRIMS